MPGIQSLDSPPDSLDGSGLSGVQIDVLLQIELLDGSNFSAIVRPTSPAYEIPLKETKREVAFSYSLV